MRFNPILLLTSGFLLISGISQGQTPLLTDDGSNIFTVPQSNNFGIGLTNPKRLLHLFKNGNNQASAPPTIRLEYCLADGQTEPGGGGGNDPDNDEPCDSGTLLWDIYNNHSLNFSSSSKGIVFNISQDGDALLPYGYLRVGANPGAVASGQNRLLVTEGRIMVGQEGIPGMLYSHLQPNDLKFNRDDYSSYIAQMGTGSLAFVTNGDYSHIRMFIDQAGNVGIGNNTPDYKLDVCGTIRAGHVKVENTTGWCDYVFDKGYKLAKLSEIEAYIQQNNHLPEVPSEEEVLTNGVDLGEMNKILLKKVEELTLYLIEMEKRVNELEAAR